MVEFEPDRNRSRNFPDQPVIPSAKIDQDEEFDPVRISNNYRAESYVRGIRNGIWVLSKYKKDRRQANIIARRVIADTIYSIRPKSGDLSPEANKARKTIHLIVEARNKVIKGDYPHSDRPEDKYAEVISYIVSNREDDEPETGKNLVAFPSGKS